MNAQLGYHATNTAVINLETNVNLSPAALTERALERGEGHLAATGALVIETGARTGRSAGDKRIVRNASTEEAVSWGDVNMPVAPEVFDKLFGRVRAYLDACETFTFEGFAGVRPEHAKDFRIRCEWASHALFMTQLLHASNGIEEDPFEIIVAPGFACDPERDGTASNAAIMIDYEARRALIAGTGYSGEIKKSVFSIMNFLLPSQGVLPMHCSANMAPDRSTAIFFGLSGTGKTTLSADPSRLLIGDDEHGWADDEVFNFEAGCYAKCIDLDPEREPDIFHAIRFGALAENVVMDPDTRVLCFTDPTITENTRAGYPLTHIKNIEPSGRGPVPKTVIFLTADAFGVLPPIARLDRDQAMYYFLSGYTSKVAGTEVGVTTPEPTFSTCFGEPFLPLAPQVYARMLKEKVTKADAQVFLVNTGWNGRGERMPLARTRAMINAALSGAFKQVSFRKDAIFGFEVPESCPGCPEELLDPTSSWKDAAAYRKQAEHLARLFHENFSEKHPSVSQEIRDAGPRL